MLYTFLEDQAKVIRNETEIRDVTTRKEERNQHGFGQCDQRQRNCQETTGKYSVIRKQSSEKQIITKGAGGRAFFNTRNNQFLKSTHNSTKKNIKSKDIRIALNSDTKMKKIKSITNIYKIKFDKMGRHAPG